MKRTHVAVATIALVGVLAYVGVHRKQVADEPVGNVTVAASSAAESPARAGHPSSMAKDHPALRAYALATNLSPSPQNLDEFEALQARQALCRRVTSLTPQRIAQIKATYGDTERSAQSLAHLETQRHTICRGISVPKDGPLYLELERQRVALSKLPGNEALARFVEAMADRHDGGALTDTARSELATIAQSTDSPALFLEAVRALNSERWSPGGWEYGKSADISEDEARELGAWLAYCGKYDVCGAGSLVTLQQCSPSNCRPGLTVYDYLREKYSPLAMQEAQAFARAVRAQ